MVHPCLLYNGYYSVLPSIVYAYLSHPRLILLLMHLPYPSTDTITNRQKLLLLHLPLSASAQPTRIPHALLPPQVPIALRCTASTTRHADVHLPARVSITSPPTTPKTSTCQSHHRTPVISHIMSIAPTCAPITTLHHHHHRKSYLPSLFAFIPPLSCHVMHPVVTSPKNITHSALCTTGLCTAVRTNIEI